MVIISSVSWPFHDRMIIHWGILIKHGISRLFIRKRIRNIPRDTKLSAENIGHWGHILWATRIRIGRSEIYQEIKILCSRKISSLWKKKKNYFNKSTAISGSRDSLPVSAITLHILEWCLQFLMVNDSENSFICDSDYPINNHSDWNNWWQYRYFRT